jgi:excisionase family DNA binding protein
MQLSLPQAAEILGKSRRQVKYLIEQGLLPATKVGGRWVLERDDLQMDEIAQQRASLKQAQLQASIEEALKPSGKKRFYTLRDIKAVQLATPLYRELLTRGDGWQKAAQHMRECLDQLAVGCHRYDRREKAAAYSAARDAASLAAIEIVLAHENNDDRTEQTLLDTIEQELMPAFAGLLRRNENKTL